MTSHSQAYVSCHAYGQAFWPYSFEPCSEPGLERLPDAASSAGGSYQDEVYSPDSLAPSPMIMTPDGAYYPPTTQYDAWTSDVCGEAAPAPACSCASCMTFPYSDDLSNCATDLAPPDSAPLYAATDAFNCSGDFAYAGAAAATSGPSHGQCSSAPTSVAIAPGMSAWSTAYRYSDPESCGVGIPSTDAFSHQIPAWPEGLGASDLAETGLTPATEDPYLLCPDGSTDSPFDPYRGFATSEMDVSSGEISEEEEKYRRASQVIHPRPRRNIPIVSLDKLASSTETRSSGSPAVARRTYSASRPSDGHALPRAAHLYRSKDASDVYLSSGGVGMPYSHYYS